jgi:hypothetical protein
MVIEEERDTIVKPTYNDVIFTSEQTSDYDVCSFSYSLNRERQN